MTEHTKISPEGSLNLSKDVVEQEGWRPGTELEVLHIADGILIREKRAAKPGIDWEEFRRRMPKYEGPPVSLEDMERGIELERARRWARKERDSR
jgi:hypothetical protein